MRADAILVAALAVLPSPAWAQVSGRVLGPDGMPVAGVAVTAYTPETPDERAQRLVAGRTRTAAATARSAPDGTFRIEGSQPLLILGAQAAGFAARLETVLAGDAAVTLRLKRAPVRRGVVTAAGRPVSGARVVWFPSTGGADWLALSGVDGSFEVPDPRVWADQVVVFHPDFAPLLEANDGQHLDQKLERGVAIEGSIRDERNAPLGGATVWVGAWTRWPLATTGRDGTFRVAHAPSDWGNIAARTPALAGAAGRKPGRVSIVARPARSLSGTVRDESGRPLAGATVWAMGRNGQNTVSTDALGRYTLDGLAAGRYQASASRARHETSSAGDGEAGQIDLRAAQRAQHDFVLRKLPVVSGRVEDEAHRPVEGALVTLGLKNTPHIYAADAFSEMGAQEARTYTTTDGSFTLAFRRPEGEMDQLFLGDRPLIVLKAGYAAARAEFKQGPAGAERPVVVTLTRGIELKGRVRAADGKPLPDVGVTLAEDGTYAGTMMPTHILLAAAGEAWAASDTDGRFQVHVHAAIHHLAFHAPGLAPKVVRGHDPRSGEPLDVVLDPAATVRGRVARADGSGVTGVVVSLSQPSSPQPATTNTAADGSFELKDLARGSYELTAVNAELLLNVTRTVEAPSPDVHIVLDPAGSVRGRVVDAVTRQPVRSFQMFLQRADGRAPRQVRVDDDAAGAFTVADVPPGDVSLAVRAEGYATKRLEGVSVALGSEPPELEVALDADVAIRGRITREDKSPIAEAVVRLTADEGGARSSATADDDGEYELRGVAAGDFTLTFQARGFLTEKRALDTAQATRLDVTLRRGLTLSGDVLSDGVGVAGADVTATSSAANAADQAARTDERGRFKIEGLVPGRYSVQAVADKGRARLDDVDAESAGPLRLVLARGRTAVLTGKVVGLPSGDQALMAMVMAQGEEEDASASALVDGSLAFRMDDAPAGRVTVSAHAVSMPAGMMRTSRKVELTLAPGSETETVIEFPADVVSGVVTRDGAPVPNVMVSFDGGRTAGGAVARTDARGAYEVVGLDPGPNTVRVFGDGTTFTTEYVVSGSGQFDIDITGGAVQGRVVRADGGGAVREVEVSFWLVGTGENRPATTATTSEGGEFSARSLREGRYRLTTSKAGFGQQVRELEVARGAPAQLVLELSPAVGVSVAVVDARDSRPLEATVVVRDAARHIVANRHSGVEDDGTLNIPLADGAYLLSTSASGYGTATVPVTSPAQGLRVGLTPGGSLVIESTRDLKGRVRLVQPDGEEYVQCWCNGIAEIQLAGRRTTVEHITAGSYTLEVVEAQAVLSRQPVVIREGQKSMVTID